MQLIKKVTIKMKKLQNLRIFVIMSLDVKIAKKYIFNGKINLISIITFISILGITVGVAALIVVLSIFNGFRQLSEEQLLGFDPHIRIVSKNSAYLSDVETITQKIKNNPCVKKFSPALTTRAVVYKSNNLQLVELIAYTDMSYLSEISSRFYEFNLPKKDRCIYIGYALASRIDAKFNDTLQIISAKMLEKSIQTFQVPQGIAVQNAGVFNSNIKDYDLSLAFTDIGTAKRLLLKNEDIISQIDIKLFDKNDLEKTVSKLNEDLKSESIKILTWIDLNKELYYIMQFERVAVFSILSLILLIAIFNVFASLAMTIVKKKSDIAILKSIGANNKFIRNIFIKEGVIIGIIGTFLGLILSFIIVFLQEKFGIFAIDGSKYIMDRIPMAVNVFEVLFISFFSISLAVIATIFPAKKAANSNIIQSIRTE
jgi:lipoprotein-releasing system permease protein